MNFAGLTGETDATSSAVVGSSAERLERVRARYDPVGLFERAAHRA
jgi:hypothetical protein